MKNIKQKELFITTILEDFLCADKYDREKVEEPNVAYVRDCLEREVSAMVEHGLIETKFTIDDYLAAFYEMKDLFTKDDIVQCLYPHMRQNRIRTLFNIHQDTQNRALTNNLELTEASSIDAELREEMLLICRIYFESIAHYRVISYFDAFIESIM
jgi:hypothetical protein